MYNRQLLFWELSPRSCVCLLLSRLAPWNFFKVSATEEDERHENRTMPRMTTKICPSVSKFMIYQSVKKMDPVTVYKFSRFLMESRHKMYTILYTVAPSPIITNSLYPWAWKTKFSSVINTKKVINKQLRDLPFFLKWAPSCQTPHKLSSTSKYLLIGKNVFRWNPKDRRSRLQRKLFN